MCVVCQKRPISGRLGIFCRVCGNSYDRVIVVDATMMTIIEWAAKRARRFARGAR